MKRLLLHGAPLHPLLVHFPVTAWTLALLADAFWLSTGQPLAWQIGWWSLAAGCGTALPALAAGFAEYLALGLNGPRARAAERHMWLMSSAWTVFTLDWLLRARAAPSDDARGTALTLLTLAGFLLLTIGGHYGARLVYHLGVGQSTTRDTEPG